jgi:PAS domain S-box-containing protein
MKKQKAIKVLLIEDDEDDYVLFKKLLGDIKNIPYQLTWASSYEKGLTLISEKNHDIYIFDYLLGQNTAIDLLRYCRELKIKAPIILLTGLSNQAADIAAMELGAADFLEKGEITSITLERSMRHAAAQGAVLEELKASEKKFRRIFEHSYDVIYLAKEDGTIMDINPSAQRVFGYEKSELLNMNAAKLYDNAHDRIQLLKDAHQRRISSNNEIVYRNKNGNKKHCIVSASLHDADESGQPTYVAVIRDITQRKKIEQELIIAEKNAVIGRVVHTLAHEIRSPLASIYLAIELLQKELNHDPMYLEIVKRSSRQIDNIIKEFLQSATHPDVKMQKHSISKILSEALAQVNDRAALNKITIENSTDVANCNIMADKENLKIAIVNILVNAIEAVATITGKIQVKTIQIGKRINIEIEDNGTGIPEKSLSNIFEPYYTSKNNGVGLGLAATHNIIHSLNGTIEVESEVGKGTKFIIGLECV